MPGTPRRTPDRVDTGRTYPPRTSHRRPSRPDATHRSTTSYQPQAPRRPTPPDTAPTAPPQTPHPTLRFRYPVLPGETAAAAAAAHHAPPPATARQVTTARHARGPDRRSTPRPSDSGGPVPSPADA